MASDEEKAAMELQERVLMGAQAINRLIQQEKQTVMRKQRIELTLAELSALPESADMYRSVGKAYFKSSKAQVVANAKESITELGSEVETLRKQKAAVDQKHTEAQNELRELVQGLKGLKT